MLHQSTRTSDKRFIWSRVIVQLLTLSFVRALSILPAQSTALRSFLDSAGCVPLATSSNCTLKLNMDFDCNKPSAVVCDAQGNVKVLSLDKFNLTGTMSGEIGRLTLLDTLDMSDNRLTGSIPPELGNLTALTFLDLSVNRLSGGVAQELSKLKFLAYLDLAFNRLAGTIPFINAPFNLRCCSPTSPTTVKSTTSRTALSTTKTLTTALTTALATAPTTALTTPTTTTTTTTNSISETSFYDATTSDVINPSSISNNDADETPTWLYGLVGGLIGCVVLLVLAILVLVAARRRKRDRMLPPITNTPQTTSQFGCVSNDPSMQSTRITAPQSTYSNPNDVPVFEQSAHYADADLFVSLSQITQ